MRVRTFYRLWYVILGWEVFTNTAQEDWEGLIRSASKMLKDGYVDPCGFPEGNHWVEVRLNRFFVHAGVFLVFSTLNVLSGKATHVGYIDT